MLACCIDKYIKMRQAASDKSVAKSPNAPAPGGGSNGNGDSDEADEEEDLLVTEFAPQVERIVNEMFDRCFRDGSYEQALGIAIEARRVDMVREAINRSPRRTEMLVHAFDLCQSVVTLRSWRREVLGVLVELYRQADVSDYVSLCNCLQALDDSPAVAVVLADLLKSDEEVKNLLAYQAAFDLCENENQKFVLDISAALPTDPFAKKATPATAAPAEAESAALSEEQMMANIEAARAAEGGEATAAAAAAAAPEAEDATPPLFPEGHSFWSRLRTLQSILVGGLSVRLYLQFLYKNNKADLILLGKIKDKLPERNSVCHSAAVVCHGYMHCGTTVDTFLRKNLEWLSKASNWAKFNAIGSLGVVHKGHLAESRTLLEPYLPKDAAMSTRPYQEGGALFALGLIHANKGGQGDTETVSYLLENLLAAGRNQTEKSAEVIQHGASLGLGLAAMGTGSLDHWEKLKNVLYSDSAVAGEGAAIAAGLMLLGTAKQGPVQEMLQYAHDTKHDKIIRGLSLGIALTMLGQEEQADGLIDRLQADNDAILRCSAMWTTASAYAGTTNNRAIRRLLHVAVSDVNDDVRRTAVMALGFVMLRKPDQVPRLVALLAESYNPHVRYGACLAVGISCAGTGADNAEAMAIVKPMLEDKVSFVRQGALMSMALMLMQENDARCPAVKELREKIDSVVGDKHQGVVAKFGATLAAGILDAGGRNMCVALTSRTGFLRQGAVVGMMCWLHYWYWYPLLQFFSLALAPTAIIGVTKDMKIASKFKMTCSTKPSLFAYTAALEEEKEEKKERITTAVLSTTAKAKAKAKLKQASTKSASTARDEADKNEGATDKDGDAEMADASGEGDSDKKKEEAKKEKEPKEPEPDSFMLSNPSRVTYAQHAFVMPDPTNRYRPVHTKQKRNLGVVVLTDSTPDEEDDELMEIEAPPKAGEEGPEPECPEPFEWVPPEFKSGAK
jgi:26S proteasome regulatory subunit N2